MSERNQMDAGAPMLVRPASRLLEAFYSNAWAIIPEKLVVISGVLEAWARGTCVRPEAFNDRPDRRAGPEARRAGAVAVVPLFGTIVQRAGLVTEYSGGTSAERFISSVRAALADPTVDAVVLDVDSPGGAVAGTVEAANALFSMRGQKPIVAVANSLAASAAYWIATQADEVVVTPSGDVGSIGVFSVHHEDSVAAERYGVKTTLVSAGKFKTAGNPYEPLGDEARALMQSRVDDAYVEFVSAVARGRGVSPKDVRSGFGEGAIVGASEAKRLGMADRVATLDETVARLSGRGGKRARSAAIATLDLEL